MPSKTSLFFTHSSIARTILIVAALIVGESLLVALLNREVMNNVLFPISQYMPMFSVIWRDNPWAAIQVVADKSILAVGHYDERSGLYLWTLEFDILSLALHLLAAAIIARVLRISHAARTARAWPLVLTGCGLVILSHTYVTVMAHCAGPTWAGFVTLYGFGVEKFPVNATWQWLFAISGACVLAWFAYLQAKHRSSTRNSNAFL